MFVPVLPLRAIAFQILFLLVAIAIEAIVLRRELFLGARKAVEYAATLNLFTAAVGWLIFFSIQAVIPLDLQQVLLTFIFFGWLPPDQFLWIILAGFVVFFLSFFAKVFALTQLKNLLLTDQERIARREATLQRRRLSQPKQRGLRRTGMKAREVGEDARQASAILLANAMSYTAISILLLLRLLFDSTIRLPAG
ncbi:MAG TPA: hypothetical protein IGS37_12225 [Synechococcales cyanobacterium M55_K2018_004]|nr:hypothetical protein [Synechococcales cyanobacterium M55_K2018_004]